MWESCDGIGTLKNANMVQDLHIYLFSYIENWCTSETHSPNVTENADCTDVRKGSENSYTMCSKSSILVPCGIVLHRLRVGMY